MAIDPILLGSIGRWLIILSFLAAGIFNVMDSAIHIGRLKAFNVPSPTLAFWIGKGLLFLGCGLIATRWHTGLGALCLIVFTVTATAIYHRFWTKTDPMQRTMSRIILVGNVAIVGGLMLIWAFG